ncbi:hydroxymethylbilane synthase [Buchnera aphidicola (Mollitrichosiphum nigrofasciatum)]|uniref:hydroxymethylbilane synthase n=1 Tax=Buchnera aphidicola TaxID=9 RepID=UPI0031B8A7B3
MFKKKIRIVTRNSPLALKQTHYVTKKLNKLYPKLEIEIIPIITKGDVLIKNKIKYGKDLFIKELEIALLENKADIAIHSVKDIPNNFSKELSIINICKRVNALDALISNKYNCIKNLPKNAKIGTSSIRRKFQLIMYRPDLKIIPIRGNVETRIKKLDSGKYDGIILAVAGLNRLGIQNRIREIIKKKILLPPCGQGAIGIQTRINDTFILFLISNLNHRLTKIRIIAERAFCKKLGVNCNIPVGIYANFKNKNLKLKGLVGSPDGRYIIQGTRKGPLFLAEYMGKSLATELLDKGGKKILKKYINKIISK